MYKKKHQQNILNSTDSLYPARCPHTFEPPTSGLYPPLWLPLAMSNNKGVEE